MKRHATIRNEMYTYLVVEVMKNHYITYVREKINLNVKIIKSHKNVVLKN